MLEFAKSISAAVADSLGMDFETIYELVTVQQDIHRGDISLPCFQLAERLKRAPEAIAEDACKAGAETDVVARAEQTRGYANFFLHRDVVIRKALSGLMDGEGRFKNAAAAEGRTVVIDFSSPNIAKPFGIHHIRTTAIGGSLARIWEAAGAKVVRINYLGDWGSQFGLIILGYKRFGDRDKVEQNPVKALYEIYVRASEEAEKDAAFKEQGRAEFLKLEQGDEENRKLWEWFREESLRYFRRVYDLLDLSFDHYWGEAYYADKTDDAVSLLKSKKLLSESEGATIVDLEPYGMPPCIVRKSDEATIYATRDLAAALHRYRTFHFDRMLYVVGHEQSLHFKQVFKVLELAGLDWANRCSHVPFALMRFADAKISTRKGNVVFLEEVLDEAIERVRRIIRERRQQAYRDRVREKVLNDEEIESVAHAVGTGAVVFNALYVDNNREVLFDWDRQLDFNGETGPYVQYSHARVASILAQASPDELKEADPKVLSADAEYVLARAILRLPLEADRARLANQPAQVARYLISLTKVFNQFYDKCHVLGSEGALRRSRLVLVDAAREALAVGLDLLGLQAPSKM